MCEWCRRPECSNGLQLSAEALDSDLWVSSGCVNGLGLWNISIQGMETHGWICSMELRHLSAANTSSLRPTAFWMCISAGSNVSVCAQEWIGHWWRTSQTDALIQPSRSSGIKTGGKGYKQHVDFCCFVPKTETVNVTKWWILQHVRLCLRLGKY